MWVALVVAFWVGGGLHYVVQIMLMLPLPTSWTPWTEIYLRWSNWPTLIPLPWGFHYLQKWVGDPAVVLPASGVLHCHSGDDAESSLWGGSEKGPLHLYLPLPGGDTSLCAVHLHLLPALQGAAHGHGRVHQKHNHHPHAEPHDLHPKEPG